MHPVIRAQEGHFSEPASRVSGFLDLGIVSFLDPNVAGTVHDHCAGICCPEVCCALNSAVV